MLIAAGALAAVAVGVGAVLALGGGDDDDPSGGEAAASGTENPATTEAPTTAPTTTPPPPAGLFIAIDSVGLEDGRYRVDYRVTGFDPQVDGGPDSLHLHFFPNTTEHDNAGQNGTPRGEWNLTDEPQSFLTEFTPENTTGATQMCAAVADVGHNVHIREGDPTGNCADLPA